MIGTWEEFKSNCWKLLEYSQEICNLIIVLDGMKHGNFIDYSKNKMADTVYDVLRIKEEIAKLAQQKQGEQNGN